LNPEGCQCFPNIVELERFDDGHDQLHVAVLSPGCRSRET
jgi:hypothetical protein